MEVTEEMIQQLMRIWPGNLPHKRAKKKLQYAAEHGCPLLSHCLDCAKIAACPVLEEGGKDEQ